MTLSKINSNLQTNQTWRGVVDAGIDQINTNTTAIASNATNIASNDTDIATNVTNIATNAGAGPPRSARYRPHGYRPPPTRKTSPNSRKSSVDSVNRFPGRPNKIHISWGVTQLRRTHIALYAHLDASFREFQYHHFLIHIFA